MPAGQLYINNKDAYTQWGISLDSTALSALIAPPALKEFVSDDYRLEDGVDYIVEDAVVNERQFTLPLNLTAPTEYQFFSRYASFCTELKSGTLHIRTSFQPTLTYKCIYQSCSQFQQYMRGIAKFSLKLVEPNPNDRYV